MSFVLEVEVIQHDVGRWSDLNVFVLVCEVVKQVGVYFHRHLSIQTNWNIY